MNDFKLKELQAIREGLESAIIVSSDLETVKETIEKIDAMLLDLGYRFERKAFQNEWKKVQKKPATAAK